MNENILDEYNTVRENGAGLFDFHGRGLIEVSGGEAVMFLDGLISNNVKALAEKSWMRAAFPNAQGRLLAVVRVWRLDDRYYFDTEEANFEGILKNLERFTFAGDFQVKDLSEDMVCFSVQGGGISDFGFRISDVENQISEIEFEGGKIIGLKDANIGKEGFYFYVPKTVAEKFREQITESGVKTISAGVFEILRIEGGLPVYGVDMDDTTVVPEIGFPDLISYNKGCYIGQEVIARIHFRGRVAKQLSGLVFEDDNAEVQSGDEIRSPDDKNAGKITSIVFSPKLGKKIALGYVRNAYLEEGTQLKVGGFAATVKNLPFAR